MFKTLAWGSTFFYLAAFFALLSSAQSVHAVGTLASASQPESGTPAPSTPDKSVENGFKKPSAVPKAVVPEPQKEAGNYGPAPSETSVITHHTIKLNQRTIKYAATAGNLLLRNNKEQVEASMFYIAYTAENLPASSPARPLTFLFNGGPGAGSSFLMIGSVGVKRVVTKSPAATPPARYLLEDNPDSLLDKSDLVFVDAVGAGLSRIVGSGTAKQFYGVDEDLSAYARFIDRYLTLNQRWNSPKFLFGESYGTARAAMLAHRLGDSGIALNGVVLLSSVLNLARDAPGYDIASVNYLPSYAAIAWYHNKILPKPSSLPAFLDEVRAFSYGPYAAALARGDALPADERDAIAARIAHYTGLDVDYVKASRLRIWPSRFRKQLLRGESRNLGRYDARFQGVDYDDAGERPSEDASVTGIAGAFKAALEEHLARDLHYVPQSNYRTFNSEALKQWNWKHRAWWGEELTQAYAAGDLAEAMRRNPHLMVLSANGYFDLATPFFGTEYDLSHMGLDPSLRANITTTLYSAGHMIYLDDQSLHSFKADLAKFYDSALGAAPASTATAK